MACPLHGPIAVRDSNDRLAMKKVQYRVPILRMC